MPTNQTNESDRRSAKLRLLAAAGLTTAVGITAGCQSPLSSRSEADLHAAVIRSVERELADSRRFPESRQPQRIITEPLPIDPRFVEQNNRDAGPGAYDLTDLGPGVNLYGQPQETVGVALEHAIRSAAANNLAIQFARFEPAIAETQVVAAEAAFDWVLNSTFAWSAIDQVQPAQTFAGAATNLGAAQQQILNSTTQLRRPLTSGGQFTIEQSLVYTDFAFPGQTFTPDPATQLAYTFTLQQPLLRNFGSDVALAQVRLNRNAERNAIAQLEADIIQTLHNTETTYWNLYQTYRNVLILQRLLERGESVYDKLEARRTAGLEVSQAELAEAKSRVDSRRANVFEARNALRRTSDQLKQFMNDPDLPIGSEVVLLPLDEPVIDPVVFSALDSLTTALTNRPELRQAVLAIDNTSIQTRFADNQRLPQLDLQTQIAFSNLDSDLSVYEDVFDGSFVDYIVGLVFEQPIGNRAAEANFRQARLQRMQAVVSYRNSVQNIVREVKDALDTVELNYQLVDQRRNARLSASESLRSLRVELEQITGQNATALNILLDRQERLAAEEQNEIAALANYNTAVSDMYRAMGTILERNRVEVIVPDVDERIDAWSNRIPDSASIASAQLGSELPREPEATMTTPADVAVPEPSAASPTAPVVAPEPSEPADFTPITDGPSPVPAATQPTGQALPTIDDPN